MENEDTYIGKQIGNYRIVAEIASGSFGRVYRGEHLFLKKRSVAIKLLHTLYLGSQEERENFLREAEFLEVLKHPNILPILDVGVDDGCPYLIAEYAANGSLRDRLKTYAPQLLPMQEALAILTQIGQALHYAHEQHIIHRDLKPENILFTMRGEALLADFGIATMLGSASIKYVSSAGTPRYMAPEQFKGNLSKESDQYALGCIAYELFTGRPPFTAPDFFTVGFLHISEPVIPPGQINPTIPPHIEQAILRALAKQRTERYPDVLDFLRTLQQPGVQIEPATHSFTQAQTTLSLPPLDDQTQQLSPNPSHSGKETFELTGNGTNGATQPRSDTAERTLIHAQPGMQPPFPGTQPPLVIEKTLPAPPTPKSRTGFTRRTAMFTVLSLVVLLSLSGLLFLVLPGLLSTKASIKVPALQTVTTTSLTAVPTSTIAVTTGVSSPTTGVKQTPTVVPTITPFPTSTPSPTPTTPPVQPMLSVNTSSVYANTDCQLTSPNHTSWDCSVTLSNNHNTQAGLNWTATGSIPGATGVIFSPSSGVLQPGQSVKVDIAPYYMSCPATGNITFTSPANTVKISWRCTAVATFTASPGSFTNGCLTCTITLSDPSNSPSTGNWSVFSDTINGVIFSPASGTLSPGQSVLITVTLPKTQCPANTTFNFGGTILPTASVTWKC